MTQLSRIITVVDQVTAPMNRMAGAADNFGRSVTETDGRVTRMGQSFAQLEARVDPVARAVQRVERETAGLTRTAEAMTRAAAAEGRSQDELARSLANVQRAKEAVAQRAVAGLDAETRAAALSRTGYANLATQHAAVEASSAKVTNSLGLQGYQVRNLTAQFVDLGVQLSSGGGILLPLIQQGPQAVDAVGGVGKALSLLGQVLTPTVLGVAALTATFAASIIVYEAQERALANLSNRLRATRDDYATLTGQVEASARAAAASSPISTADARTVGRTIASTPNYQGSTADLTAMAALAERLSRVMGTDVPAAGQRLAAAFDKPAEAARRAADEGLRGFDEALVRQVIRLDAQGRALEAGRLAIEGYRRTADDASRTPLERSMNALGEAGTRLWQAFRPLVETIGGALVTALTFAVDKITLLVNGMARLVEFAGDNRLTRMLGLNSDPVPEGIARGTTSREEALRRARQSNPRVLQRQSANDNIREYRDALSGSTGEDRAILQGAIGQENERLRGLTGPSEQYLKGLRAAAEQARLWAGAEREVAQALNGAREAGGGAAVQAEALALVRQRLASEFRAENEAITRNTRGLLEQAEAAGRGATAADDVRLANQAFTETILRYERSSPEFDGALDRRTQRLIRQRDAQAELNSATAAAQQEAQLEIIRRETELVGAGVEVRERELAVLRERQRIMQTPGADIDSETSRRRLANAAAIANATQELTRQRTAYDEISRIGEQAFDRIGTAITTAFANGGLKAISFGSIAKAVFSEVIQAGLRMAVINPVLNSVFGGTRATLGSISTVFGGGDASAATAAAGVASSGAGGSFSSISNALGIGRLFGGSGGGGIFETVGGYANSASNYLGIGNPFGSGLSPIATQGITPLTTSIVPGLSGAEIAAANGTGAFTSGGVGASFGGFLGGAGAGFGAGMLVNSLAGGNKLGGTIGSAGGALAGAAIGSIIPGVGTLIGGLIGGAAGGGLGGLFGPKKAFKGGDVMYGVNASGELDAIGAFGKRWDSAGATAEVRGQLAGVNDQFRQNGIRFDTSQNGELGYQIGNIGFGESKNSQAVGERAIVETLQKLGTSDNANIQSVLRRGNRSDSEMTVQSVLDDVGFVKNTYEALLRNFKEPMSEFAAQVAAVVGPFDDAIKNAEKLGLATDQLTEAREKERAKVVETRNAALQSIADNLQVRSIKANGGTAYSADILTFDTNAATELTNLRGQMEKLGTTASETADFVGKLTAAQGAERDALVKRYSDGLDALVKPVSAFSAAMTAVEVKFSSAILTAQQLGRATGDLATARDRELASTIAQRNASANGIWTDLALRSMRATGAAGLGADLMAYNANAAQEVQALTAQLAGLGTSASEAAEFLRGLEQVQADERLAIQKQYAEQSIALEKQRVDALLQQGQSIRDFIDAQRATGASGASPQDQLRAASDVWNRDLALARGNDAGALGRITGQAATYLDAARQNFASGDVFQTIRGDVLWALENLPATLGADASTAAKLGTPNDDLTAALLRAAGGMDAKPQTDALTMALINATDAFTRVNDGFGPNIDQGFDRLFYWQERSVVDQNSYFMQIYSRMDRASATNDALLAGIQQLLDRGIIDNDATARAVVQRQDQQTEELRGLRSEGRMRASAATSSGFVSAGYTGA